MRPVAITTCQAIIAAVTFGCDAGKTPTTAPTNMRSSDWPVSHAATTKSADDTFAPSSARSTGGGQRWAVLIGVNDYAEVNDLEYCVPDVEALGKQLVACGFPSNQVILISDAAKENRYRPLKTNIERQLDLVLAAAAAGDFVLVAFSGHGVSADGTSYLCPSEARTKDPSGTMLRLDAVYDKLSACAASLKLFLVDACRNEIEQQGQRSFKAATGTKEFATALERVPPGILLLTSCNPGQISMEDAEFGHGVFMNYLLEGLRGKADEEAGNHNRSVSLLELYSYASQQTKAHVLKRYNISQVPALRGELSDDFEISAVEPPKEFTNSIGMRLTLIPPGEFMMGSPEGEEGHSADEEQHRVRISQPFYLGMYEVTQEEYERVMGENPSAFSASGYSSASVGNLDTKRFPVEQVSWDDADEFCRKLSQLPDEAGAGRRYRLPTEAEWEYACRAGTTTPFCYGNEMTGRGANYDGNYPYGSSVKGPYLARPTTVGSYRPNAFGLYDMHGNVWEWCSDWYDEGYYARSPTTDPKGPSAGSSRVARGGGWLSPPVVVRCADRVNDGPGLRFYSDGFRVVCELE